MIYPFNYYASAGRQVDFHVSRNAMITPAKLNSTRRYQVGVYIHGSTTVRVYRVISHFLSVRTYRDKEVLEIKNKKALKVSRRLSIRYPRQTSNHHHGDAMVYGNYA